MLFVGIAYNVAQVGAMPTFSSIISPKIKLKVKNVLLFSCAADFVGRRKIWDGLAYC
jgi:hypothetical protein